MTSSPNSNDSKKRKMKSFDELFADAAPEKAKGTRQTTPHATDVRWLRVGGGGAGGANQGDDQSGYWWPVRSLDEGAVEVYGDDGHGFRRRVKADKESLATFKREGVVRYTPQTFYTHETPPPCLVDAFQTAVKSASIDDEDSKDDLPDVDVALYVSTPSASQVGQVTQVDSDSSPVSTQGQTETHSGHSEHLNHSQHLIQPDRDINIAEKEGVLSRYYKSSKTHWPARVIGFDSGLYLLEFNDATVRKLPRACFFTCAEKGFRECELGMLEKVGGDQKKKKRGDKSRYEYGREGGNRKVFGELDMATQVQLCLPIIDRIIHEQYTPALEKHKQFVRGGLSRKAVGKQVCYGEFSGCRDEIVEIIREYLKPGEEGEESAQEKAYEKLTPPERVAYMLDVLFPEVLIQIVIHSEGLDGESASGYRRACEILKAESADRDWIDRIYAQRQFHEPSTPTQQPEQQLYHSSGRPVRKKTGR